MKKIKEFCKKTYNSPYFPFIILFYSYLLINSLKNIGFGDDSWFMNILSNKDIIPNGTIVEYLKWRYNVWTSRIIIEFFMVGLLNINIIIWKVFDSALIVLLAYSISRIFVNKSLSDKHCINMNWIIVGLLFIIPTTLFSETGYVATSMNYLFPVSMGMFSLIYIKKILDNQSVGKIEAISYILAAIIATNMEQMTAILLVVYLIFLVYFLKTKKKCRLLAVLLIIAILGVVNILICPGNEERSIQEIRNWYIEYETFSLIDKFAIGISSMMQFLILKFNLLYTVFTGLIMINVLKKYETVFPKLIAIIPFLFSVIFSVFGELIMVAFPELYNQFSSLPYNSALIRTANGISFRAMFAILIYIGIILCLFISLILIFKKSKKTLLAIIVLGAGICSRILIGFSATVWASGDRTCFCLMISMIIICLLILEHNDEKSIQKFVNLATVFFVLGFLEHFILNYIYW